MTPIEWFTVSNTVFTTGAIVFLAVNRWITQRGHTEIKLTQDITTNETRFSRDLAESERLRVLRESWTEYHLKRLESRVEQVHKKATDRMVEIDKHIDFVDGRVLVLETLVKLKNKE